MSLDWSRVGAGQQEPLVRPRDIFSALPNRRWPYLRQEQGEVLEKWFDRREDRDIVIKQNTGGGKTAAGLLIAQSTLNEGAGKAVYLAPDTYLASRVCEEAAGLGVATAADPGDLGFLSGQAVLVATFQKLVNGRSVFGVAGDGREPPDLGVVIVDDAHAALATTEGQFRLTVPAAHSACAPLVNMFAEDLRAQSANAWADICAGDATATARVPFWSWAARQAEVMAVLHPYRGDRELMFTWPLIAGVLPLCAATVTSRGIEIRPPCPPITMIPAFARARRRVYLTATLADDSILVTDLDADPALVAAPVTPGSAADLGDRMIIAPAALNPTPDEEDIRRLAFGYAHGDRDGDGVTDAAPVNVVVLVPSAKAAQAWAPYANRTCYVGDLQAGVAALKAGHVGLVVLVNKYDGIDLPGKACELLVLDGVPTPMDAWERRESAVLAGSPVRLAREVQRIEQGMGRGVRDTKDHCAVLLLGPGLARATWDQRYVRLFSPATRAQIALSRDIAALIRDGGLSAVRTALNACLDRDPEWTRRSGRALAEVRYAAAGVVRPEAVALRQAFDLAAAGQPRAAADRVQLAVNGLEDPATRGWLMEQKAAYLNLTDPGAAQALLASAVRENPYVLRPAAGISPAAARPAAAQARAAAEFLAATYPDGMSLVLGVKSMLEQIQWDEDRTDEAEAAWARLGQHLGFGSTRPEKQFGTGPDNLWVLGAGRHAVTELKTGAVTAAISKHDLDQLGGSVRWDQQHFPGVTSVPVMVHPSRDCHGLGTPVPGMLVVTPDRLGRLKAAVTALAVTLADGQGRWADEQAAAAALAQQQLTGGQVFSVYAEPARPAPGT